MVGRTIAVLRFLNVLDDDINRLSPVKINTWAANLGAVSTAVGTALAWVGGHTAGIETIAMASAGWLTQAHATRHFDKRERNLQTARLAGAPDVHGS